MFEIPQAASQSIQPGQNPAELDAWQFGANPVEAISKLAVPVEEIQAMGGSAISHTEQTGAGTPTTEQPSFSFSFGEAYKTVSDLRTETVDNISFRTNLPEGVWPFEPTEQDEAPAHPYSRRVLPSGIDSLPVGEFHIGNPDTEDAQYDRKIIISEDADGKYINRIADMGLIRNAGKTEGMMLALGYKFDRSGHGSIVDAVPSPSTIQKNAAKLGVDIQFFNDQKLIAGKDYLEAFASGKFPVSTASAEYYLHDTRDDHLTAMVVGGEPLKAALRDAAKNALESGTNADVVAKEVDDYTAYLRGAVSPTYNNLDYPYSDQEVRTIGERIGIPMEKTNEILATARANAHQEWGMELNPVPVSLQKAA